MGNRYGRIWMARVQAYNGIFGCGMCTYISGMRIVDIINTHAEERKLCCFKNKNYMLTT